MFHENFFIRSKPFNINTFLNFWLRINLLTVSVIDFILLGLKYNAASPAISGKELELLMAIGHPQLNDSRIGIPNPSYKEGYTNIIAFL